MATISITDEQDSFAIKETSIANTVSTVADSVTVDDGDLSVKITELSDAITISTNDVEKVSVTDSNDSITLTFSEVLQPITNNYTVSGNILTGTASEDLGGHRMVVAFGSQISYADNTNPDHIAIVAGITTQAVLSGNSVNVTIGGEVVEGSWTWTLNSPIFLTANGLLTQTAPNTGFLLQVAYPTSTTSLVIDIKTAITLS